MRSSSSSSTGDGCRRERPSNQTTSTADTTQQAMTRSSPQPQSGALTMPSASSPTDAASIAEPSTSGAPAVSGSRRSTSSRRPGSTPSAMTRFTKNAQRQPPASTSTPPSDGPAAAATAPAAAHSDTAVARFSGANSGNSRPSEVGISAAAPHAWTIRAATSSSAVGARPHSSEPRTNTYSPE
jgi:hypothetical protein